MTDAGLRAVFLAERAQLLRLLAARLGSAENAEDVLQDMWLKLDAPTSGPVAKPAAYLFRMANNLAIDRRRAEMRHAARDTDWLAAGSRPDEIPGIERTLLARERLRQVEAALASLPERTARAFRMFRFEGRSQKFIAADLGVSLSSVEKILQVAYRKIHDDAAGDVTGSTSRRRLDVEEDRGR